MKITIIGAGNVGSLTALRLAQENAGELVLIDIVSGVARGKAFDMLDASALVKVPCRIEGTQDIEAVRGSDIIVITAGLARKPGMTREELLQKNAGIMKELCLVIKRLAPDAIVVVVTNPLDIMTNYCLRVTGFEPRRVIGMGLSLDAARFANLVARELKVESTAVDACVIGSHGEGMMPLARFTLVNGVPLEEMISGERIQALVAQTVGRGAEIVSLLGSGSAYFAPSAAAASLTRAIVRDEKKVIGACAFLQGEYGVSGVCIGAPCRVGGAGIEEVIELRLHEDEKKAFLASAEKIRLACTQLSL